MSEPLTTLELRVIEAEAECERLRAEVELLSLAVAATEWSLIPHKGTDGRWTVYHSTRSIGIMSPSGETAAEALANAYRMNRSGRR